MAWFNSYSKCLAYIHLESLSLLVLFNFTSDNHFPRLILGFIKPDWKVNIQKEWPYLEAFYYQPIILIIVIILQLIIWKWLSMKYLKITIFSKSVFNDLPQIWPHLITSKGPNKKYWFPYSSTCRFGVK